MTGANDDERQVRDTIDREAALISSAVRLVASGASSRTVVAGLRLAEAALTVARPLAMELHVVLEPLWSADEDGTDVVVSRPALEDAAS